MNGTCNSQTNLAVRPGSDVKRVDPIFTKDLYESHQTRRAFSSTIDGCGFTKLIDRDTNLYVVSESILPWLRAKYRCDNVPSPPSVYDIFGHYYGGHKLRNSCVGRHFLIRSDRSQAPT